MMITPVFSLPEPEGEDFANGALQLQMLAEAMDQYLYDLNSNFTNNLRTSAFIGHTNSAYTIASTAPLQPFNDNANILLNAGGLITDYNNNFTNGVLIPEQGSYIFGAGATMVATGTVNANSVRTMMIGASVPSGPQFTSQKEYLFRETTLEPNNGQGSLMTLTGQFDYQAVPFARPLKLWWGFNHTNVGSTVSVNAGAVWWVIKLTEIGD